MNTENLTDAPARTEELLEALLNAQKKTLRQTQFAMAANLVLGVILIVIIAAVIAQARGQLRHAEQSLSEIDALVADAEVLIGNANTVVTDNADAVAETIRRVNTVAADAEVLIENANAMVADNTDAVTETVQKLNSVDFEGLNTAITNLNTAIQPLSRFAGLFSR